MQRVRSGRRREVARVVNMIAKAFGDDGILVLWMDGGLEETLVAQAQVARRRIPGTGERNWNKAAWYLYQLRVTAAIHNPMQNI